MAPVEDACLVYATHLVASEYSHGKDPWIEMIFTTATNKPWTLERIRAHSRYVVFVHQFEETNTQNCTVQGVESLCQTWFLKFTTTRHCTKFNRDLEIAFLARYAHVSSYEEINIPIQFGGSSAFECAEDVGEFAITSQALVSTDGETYTTDAEADLFTVEQRGYIQIALSSASGAISSVELRDLKFYSSAMPSAVRCDEHCKDLLNVQIIDSRYWRFTFSFFLAKVLFPYEEVVSVDIEMHVNYRLPALTGTSINVLTNIHVSDGYAPQPSFTSRMDQSCRRVNRKCPMTTQTNLYISKYKDTTTEQPTEVREDVPVHTAVAKGGSPIIFIAFGSGALVTMLCSCIVYAKCLSKPQTNVPQENVVAH